MEDCVSDIGYRRWFRNTGERKHVDNWPYTADVTLQCHCGFKCLGLQHRIRHEESGDHIVRTVEVYVKGPIQVRNPRMHATLTGITGLR